MDLYATSQPFTLSTRVTNVATGLLADPGALVLSYINVTPGSVAVTKTWPTPADITRDGAGLFHYDVPAGLAAGHYRLTWISTGANAGEKFDVFDIFDPATYPRLVSFADAKEFVGLTGTAKDALLDRIIGWASARILREVQAVTATVTDRVTVAAGGFVLPTTPVQAITAITAVTPYSPVIPTVNAYIVNQLGGVVELHSTAAWGVYDVTYTAGYSETPPGATGACESLIRHWWNQSQAHGSATYGDSGFVPDFADLPNVVQNMLRSVPHVSGVA